jgi:hypothetical protein
MATPGGLEPPTFSLEGCCSIRLSYGAHCRNIALVRAAWECVRVPAEATKLAPPVN